MSGPIDFIIVGFVGNTFDGSILKALDEAVKKGVIDVLDMAMIRKDEHGKVSAVDVTKLGDDYAIEFVTKYQREETQVTKDDIDEMADLLEKNTAAGLLVIEQLWAKPLKQAIMKAKGVLVAEGRIHPEAVLELSK